MSETSIRVSVDAMTLLGGLVVDDDGTRWGARAHKFQRADAESIIGAGSSRGRLRRPSQRWIYCQRGRGMSKTEDLAAIALALLVTEAPPRSRSYAFAVDQDQARILHDSAAAIVARTPALAGAVTIDKYKITANRSGATLTIEASDGASALGLRPWLTIVDELAAWPKTSNYRALWSAIVSAQPKVPGSRLVVISTAGQPGGLGHGVWQGATRSRHWHTSHHPGPAPWWSAEDIDATRQELTEAEYRRLILCEWAEGDDSLTNADDVAAAVRPGSPVLEPTRGHSYVAALDVGTRRDLTALAVGHTEHRPEGPVVVIDRVMHWRPEPGAGPGARVDLAEVEAAVIRLCRLYGVRRLRFDRMQAEQLAQNLTRAGIQTSEYVFSQAGATRLARTLYIALRDRALSLPDDAELADELATVRMVETGPNTVKLSNPSGHHDDVITAIGMVAVDLIDHPDRRHRLIRPSATRRPRHRQHPAVTRTFRSSTTWAPKPADAAVADVVGFDVAGFAADALNRPVDSIAVNDPAQRSHRSTKG